MGEGFLSRAAFQIENSDYGIERAAGAKDQLHIVNESVVDEGNVGAVLTHAGLNASRHELFDFRASRGQVRCEAYYGDLDLLACALGKSHQNSPVAIATSDGYKHYFELDSDLADRAATMFDVDDGTARTLRRRGTLVIDKDTAEWEFPSVNVIGMTLNVQSQRVTCAFDVVGRKSRLDSSVQSSANWTLTADPRILFTDMRVYFKARDKFTIDSSSDGFIFRESVVIGDLTFNVTAGTYTGQQLATELEKNMNDHPDSVERYSVIYDGWNRRFIFVGTASYVIRAGEAGFQMDAVVGLYANTSSAIQHTSTLPVIPDTVAALAAADKINVSALTLYVMSQGVSMNPDLMTKFEAQQIFTTSRLVSGSIEIPRYSDNDFLQSLNGDEVYEALISFQSQDAMPGGLDVYQHNYYLPAVKITGVDVNVGGPQKIIKNVQFVANAPVKYLNLTGFAFGEYYFRDSPDTPDSGYNIKHVVSHDGELYAVADNGTNIKLYKQVKEDWSLQGTLNSFTAESVASYGGDIYIGCTAGAGDNVIYKWDGSVFSSSDTRAVYSAKSLAIHDGKLWALYDDGHTYYFNGSSWTDGGATNGAATDGFQLFSCNGTLWAAVQTATDGEVYYYTSGTTWTLSRGNGAATTAISLTRYRGRLQAVFDDKLDEYNGSSWATIDAALGVNVRHAVNFGENLLMFVSGGDPYYYDYYTTALVNIYTSFNTSLAGQLIVYADKLIIPVASSQSCKIFDPLQPLTFVAQSYAAVVNPILNGGQ